VTYTCAACGGTFTSGWSEAEAAAEARNAFGVDLTQDPTMVVVCDACYKAMTAAVPPKEWLAATGLKPIDLPPPSFTCPDCGMKSFNPHDVLNRYCGACHRFVDDPR
jgi:hypothetical protein